MTYIVPHFRYGASIYHNMQEENTKKNERVLNRIQIIFNRTVKSMYDLERNTPYAKLNKIMGKWNVLTLSLCGFARTAKIWIKENELAHDLNEG